jgi:hypothetical protein
MYLVDKVLYVNENHVVIYLTDRHFDVITNNGTALILALELLQPYYERVA